MEQHRQRIDLAPQAVFERCFNYNTVRLYIDDGLPRELAKLICVSTFKNHITHLTLDIAKPMALEVQRDIKLTFPDMLGIIGITV
jgi:hypothetical protein